MVGADSRGRIGDQLPGRQRGCVAVHDGPRAKGGLDLLDHVGFAGENGGDVHHLGQSQDARQ